MDGALLLARCAAAHRSATQSYRDFIMSRNPIAYYRLGESSGITAIDETGNYNGTYAPASGGAWTGGTLGQTGVITSDTAALFNMGGIYSDAIVTSNVSMECWLKAPANSGYALPVYNGYTGDNGVGLFIINDYVSYLMGGVSLDSSSFRLTENQWTHVALTYNISTHTLIIYANGVNVLSVTKTAGTAMGKLQIGADPVVGDDIADPFLGTLDEVAIYDYILSPSEVLASYNNGTGV